MKISEIRILPPFAIGRLGGATESPVDNFTLEDDPEKPLGYRRIVPAPTLRVNAETGAIDSCEPAATITFKAGRRIRPVAPFFELFAAADPSEALLPLHQALDAEGAKNAKIEWRVTAGNRKVERRTGDPGDQVLADTGWFADHNPHVLEGKCRNFISAHVFIDFGQVRFIRPTAKFPDFRLRFTPAKGLIYGPDAEEPAEANQHGKALRPIIPKKRRIYDHTKGWYHFGSEEEPVVNETLPPSLYAINPPAPPWLHRNVAVSRGYLDDACDGFIKVRVTLAGGQQYEASARFCAAPPAVVPDSLFVRSLADDLEQVINGPVLAPDEPFEVTRDRAFDIIRRAYETVRSMNVAVMNGNNFKGRPALSLDSMPEEEAADTERAIRPIMGPGTVDTLAIMALHQQVYAALRGGAAPWFVDLLRRPDEVADFTDRGRRKMPALMCAADNNYLALTWRQIATIERVAKGSLFQAAETAQEKRAPVAALTPRNRTAQIHYQALGNPISSRPVTSVANCCPGLEVDFRAVWRRMFEGIVLREYDNYVVEIEPQVTDPKIAALKGHRLLRIILPAKGERKRKEIPTVTVMRGPASSDADGAIILTTSLNPDGLAALEWSNLLADVLHTCQGDTVECDFSEEEAENQILLREKPKNYIRLPLRVRHFFEDETAVISQALADAGELTQGLCSPWQNDYRECSCYYWASARPDFVNMEAGADGLSKGDNWLQKERTGSYVPDDYVDSRLILYDELFRNWQYYLRFQVQGRDVSEEATLQEHEELED